MVTYRGCFRWSLVACTAVAGLFTGGATAGVPLPTGVAAAVVALVWGAFTLRVLRLAPSCGSPGSGLGPGGAGVREPRRPKPGAPGDVITLRLPEDPSGRTAALA
ncbi:hypothetical protein [Streptomyces deserti]